MLYLYAISLCHAISIIILQDSIKKLANEIFHEHKYISDQEMKGRLREKLGNDEYCADQLQKLNDKGVPFDQLWDDKLYSAVSVVIFYFCNT
jgi:hypothetical protein